MNISTVSSTLKSFFASSPVTKAWLFGSMARGTATEQSDVDILVVFDPSARVGLFEHASIAEKLSAILQRPVDLVTENALHSWIRPSVDSDKILIYERETA